jgi:cation-transporting ATPase E
VTAPRADAPTAAVPRQPAGLPDDVAGRGLDAAQVRERQARGAVNKVDQPTSRSAWAIIRGNVLTRFNALLGALTVVVLVVGPIQDALFGVLMVVNSSVGIVTELRAKRTLDRFRVLTADSVRVVRDGRHQEVAPGDVVIDELVAAAPGDQVVADGVILDALGAELDESLLTGEADPARKQPGDEVLSGSFVVAGTMHYRVTRVGAEAYANRLAEQARTFTTPPSELQDGVNTFLRWVTWALVPAAVILVATQVRALGTLDAIRRSIAAVTGMIPEGLVLLLSIAFSLAVVRLAKRKVLVQQLPAVETLARVDVVCLDKTGTLTDGRHLRVRTVEPLDPDLTREEVDAALGAVAAADPSPNASLRAIAAAAPRPDGWQPGTVVPFSSGRRWSGADFGEHGAWVLGAPGVVPMDSDTAARVEEYAGEGLRVVLLGRATHIDAEGLPADASPGDAVRLAALVAVEDMIRPDAAATVRYFAEQGVALKVLSGDHPRTVLAVARAVGIEPGGEPIDASGLADDPAEVARLLAEHSVLGRVTPPQKQRVVEALQGAGHCVAMIGDGVNDVPAMKTADLAVAVGSGTQAARAVAEIVLLTDSFASLPHVVREGRRVVSNMDRVARLFVSKSVYAFLLVVAVGIAGVAFPFVPRHLTLVSSLGIGLPGFALALGGAAPRAEPGFVRRVTRFAVPAGLVAAVATFAAYALASTASDVSHAEAQTTAATALMATSLALLALIALPLTPARLALVLGMGLAYVVVLTVPYSRKFFALDAPPAIVVLAAVGAAALGLWGLRLVGTAGPALVRRPGQLPAPAAAPDVRTLAEAGEGASVEFKASLRWDVQERRINKALERVVAKTVAGFLNGRGGTLLLGVDDAGGIVGLASDYATLSRPDRDGFERHLLQLLTAVLGGQVRRFLAVTFDHIGDKDVCVLTIHPADSPVYLRDGGDARLYVRTGNATTPLPLDEAVQYVSRRWPVRASLPLVEALLGRRV